MRHVPPQGSEGVGRAQDSACENGQPAPRPRRPTKDASCAQTNPWPADPGAPDPPASGSPRNFQTHGPLASTHKNPV